MKRSHEELQEALGAYALGQLEDVGLRDEVEDHLATCPACRDEVAAIAAIAGPLRAVNIDDIRPVGIATPTELDDRIRRALPPITSARRRWVPTVVTSALVAAAAAAAVFFISPGAESPAGPTIIAVPRVETAAGITATAGLVDHSWGLEVKLEASGLPAGETYEMWVLSDDGKAYEAGEFIGVKGNKVVCNMSSSVLLRDAVSFKVVDDRGAQVIAADLPS